MEIPIQVAVRILPCMEDSPCVQSIPMSPNFSPINGIMNNIATGIIQVGSHSTFPVTHYLPPKVQQTQIYHQTVYPLISLLLEGFDASVVTYGQKGTGKTYTLLGPGFDCIYSEAEQGIIQRCVREIFSQLATTHRERSFIINIGWVEIRGEHVRDLLEVGSVVCQSVTDVFHWLQIGLSNKTDDGAHNLFTLTLEQHWVSQEGLIQHRLSTASFSDLCGTERMYMMNSMDQHSSIPKDLGLQCLERIVTSLTDPSLIYNNNMIDYNQTTLTTLLKDSFGGRAQTLLILCVSPLERDMNETIFNLQFAFKAQCVRNFVIMNTFSDNNTPLSPDVNGNIPGEQDIPVSGSVDNFGIQFAASQWLKLVSNAEGLFTKLLGNKSVIDADREQIEEWLFLKQECEECLSSNEAIRPQKPLGPIQETEEPEEVISEPETSCQQNSDNDSDNESETQGTDFDEKIEQLMQNMKIKTDNLIRTKYDDFMKSQPKAVMESSESFRPEERKTSSGLGGRRRSIQPGASLSSAEIAMLSRVASRGENLSKSPEDFLESSSEHHPIRIHNSPIDNLQKKIRKIETDIEAKQRQIKELEQTMSLKQKLISDLIKNNDTRTTAKQRFNKKKGKLEAEYEKTKKQLSKAVVNGRDKNEVERLKALTSHIEQRLQDLASIKHIAGESGEKVKKLQKSIHDSKKHIEGLQKNLKKEKKTKDQLEAELKSLKEKENNKSSSLDEKGKNLKQVQARISHLDHVLKEKSQNLEQFKNTEEQESLRHEIRNLRRTRDHLLEQRCTLDRKLKKEKILSHREERKLLECDEAIEAIDAAIEFKNELICGRKSIDTSDRVQREKGEQMLMARLNKLTEEEMRTLLYKYFTKVIDLRDSSRKLEVQLMNLERERDAWEWRERVLSNAVRQARLEGERNAVLLQRQHETKLTLMLRHLAEETSTSSSSFNNDRMPYHHHHQQIAIGNHLTSPTSPQYDSSGLESTDFDIDLYKQHAVVAPHKQLLKVKHSDLGLCPLPPDTLTKYKPLDKIKEKDRESKNKLFAKFQVLTRYHGGGNSNHQGSNGANDKKSSKGNDLPIPEENLKQLLSAPPSTKVTRQKNKIIIQDPSRKN
ncbi:kinesin-like protein costa [Condylostylus longicornis]|uniref:kinesin-like protein costa n=1 Tax=Condylostylus longicornis TaxID=2530218 RepID=UPI00244DB587|nr:kinesin-like protein costa [Condylostylus longicornis]